MSARLISETKSYEVLYKGKEYRVNVIVNADTGEIETEATAHGVGFFRTIDEQQNVVNHFNRLHKAGKIQE